MMIYIDDDDDDDDDDGDHVLTYFCVVCDALWINKACIYSTLYE